MSDNQPDPYRVLGVDKTADGAEIKKKYRKLARQMHPDRGGDPEKLKSVNAAYQIVGDEDQRKLYDEFGHAAFRPGFDAEQARRFGAFGGGGRGGPGPGGFSFDLDDIMGMFTGGGSGPRGGFGGFGGGGPRRGGGFGRRGPVKGEDLQAKVKVSLHEALHGGERQLPLGGRDVTVRLPKGVRSGKRLRVGGRGNPGMDGGPPGDLLLEIEVANHHLVRVVRDDLEMDLPLTFVESLKGGSITVPTPTGSVKVRIPPRAEAGTKMRLKGQGLPPGGKGTRKGDLYLKLAPTPPDTEPDGDDLEALEKAYTKDVRAGLDF